jgi:hypothetical protein
MLTFLQRWFPSRSSYVSPEWLDALANRGSTEGWTEAPRIDWQANTYTGPRTRQDAPQEPPTVVSTARSDETLFFSDGAAWLWKGDTWSRL